MAKGDPAMVYLNGRDKPSFRCECGTNVFTEGDSFTNGDKQYTCNGCGQLYMGEKNASNQQPTNR